MVRGMVYGGKAGFRGRKVSGRDHMADVERREVCQT